MLILHVITSINRGGAENHLFELIKGQLLLGHKVAVAYLKGGGYWAKDYKKLNVQVFDLGLRFYGEITPLLNLKRVISNLSPDIIHAHMPPAEVYAWLALKGSKIPLFITKHNDENFYRYSFTNKIGSLIAKRANKVIAISEAVNCYIRTALKIPCEKMQTILYGIDTQNFSNVRSSSRQSLRQEWGVPSNAWLIGTVARLAPQKSLDILLESFAKYQDKAEMDSRLVIVGNGPLILDLKKQAMRLGIDQLIVWAGFREDIPEVIAAFDCFILTSSYEGFGLVLLEAMASKKPIIATSVSAIPEIVINNVTGLLCERANSDQISDAILKMEDHNLRVHYGANGFERATNLFSSVVMIEKINSLYKQSVVES
jgi:glycosyltransferase involved in cell wall biosynthesis